jgi:hypothetical protein
VVIFEAKIAKNQKKIDAKFDPEKASKNDAKMIPKRHQSDPTSAPKSDFFAMW